MKIRSCCCSLLAAPFFVSFAHAEETKVQTFLRVNSSGVTLAGPEQEWAWKPGIKKQDASADLGAEILKQAGKVKARFNASYPDRKIVWVSVIPELEMNPAAAGFDWRLIQFKIYYHIKNVTNLGPPACVGYLVRGDGEIMEQGKPPPAAG